MSINELAESIALHHISQIGMNKKIATIISDASIKQYMRHCGIRATRKNVVLIKDKILNILTQKIAEQTIHRYKLDLNIFNEIIIKYEGLLL